MQDTSVFGPIDDHPLYPNQDWDLPHIVDRMAALENARCAQFLAPRFTVRSLSWQQAENMQQITLASNQLMVLHAPEMIRWADPTTSGDEGALIAGATTISIIVLCEKDVVPKTRVALRSARVPETWKRAYFKNAYLPMDDGTDLLQNPIALSDAVLDLYPDGEVSYWAWFMTAQLELDYAMDFQYGRNFR
jgi:hypothetical protein